MVLGALVQPVTHGRAAPCGTRTVRGHLGWSRTRGRVRFCSATVLPLIH